MTMALAWPLQQAVYDRLVADAALLAELGGPKVYDGPPHAQSQEADPPYVVIGAESIEAWDAKTETGATHALTLSIWSRQRGFAQTKRVMAAVSDALNRADLPLSRGRLVDLRFVSARTGREDEGRLRRADCVFRALVEDI